METADNSRISEALTEKAFEALWRTRENRFENGQIVLLSVGRGFEPHPTRLLSALT